MSYKRVSVVLAVTAALCIGIFLLTAKKDIRKDVLYTNDIVQTVRENIYDLDVLSEKYPGQQIMVFDTAGKCIYPAGTDIKLKDAEQKNLCLAVTEENIFFGTVCIPDPSMIQYDKAYKRLRIGALILLSVMILLGVLFYFYVENSIMKPFYKLKAFTGRIAVGDLDTPLTMVKSNAFGKFIESFDIMREELKAARERENELKRKEREILASLSHDIKTPLAGIRIICDILSVKATDSYVLDKVDTISQKTNEIDMLVSDLLAASLDDMGELTVECSDESSQVLRELVIASDPKELVTQGEIPECLVSIDKKRMLQIISNVIGNSYKYADTPIEISYCVSEDYLRMTISDHGSGVSADELPLITNKFFRGSGAKDKNGSGLGLYIASELMGRMKGELICSSRGEGLTVVLMMLLS